MVGMEKGSSSRVFTGVSDSDEEGIRIEQNFERNWDDGQCDTEHRSYSTARGILNLLDKLKI